MVNSRAVAGTTEMHGGKKNQGRDQLMCALFKKLKAVTHVRCYVEVRSGETWGGETVDHGVSDTMEDQSSDQLGLTDDTHPR